MTRPLLAFFSLLACRPMSIRCLGSVFDCSAQRMHWISIQAQYLEDGVRDKHAGKSCVELQATGRSREGDKMTRMYDKDWARFPTADG